MSLVRTYCSWGMPLTALRALPPVVSGWFLSLRIIKQSLLQHGRNIGRRVCRRLQDLSIFSIMDRSVRPDFSHVGTVDFRNHLFYWDSPFQRCSINDIEQIRYRVGCEDQVARLARLLEFPSFFIDEAHSKVRALFSGIAGSVQDRDSELSVPFGHHFYGGHAFEDGLTPTKNQARTVPVLLASQLQGDANKPKLQEAFV